MGRLRKTLSNTIPGKLLDCLLLRSLWVSIPFAVLIGRTVVAE
jgi:hypothetical protein